MLSFEGQPFGEIRYEVSPLTDVLEVVAHSNIRCLANNEVQEWVRETTTSWSLYNGLRLRYSRSVYGDGMGLITTADGEEHKVKVTWEQGGLRGEEEVTCQYMPILLLEPNMFGGEGLELLPQHISWTDGAMSLIGVVDPAMACSQLTSAALVFPARATVIGQATIRVTGRMVDTAVVEVALPMALYRAYYAVETGQLVRYEIPACGVVAEITKGDPPRIVPVDLNKLAALSAKAFMWNTRGQSVKDPLRLDHVECEIDVALCAPPDSELLGLLNIGSQSFDGQTRYEDGVWRIVGHLTNQSSSNGHWIGSSADGTPELGSPVGGGVGLTQPEAKIESDHPAIVAMAREIAGDSATYWEATTHIVSWVASHIKYRVTYGTALSALETRTGDCAPRAYLVVAMLRSLGVPSRAVFGVMLLKEQVGSHAWVEVFLGEAIGWVAVDPTEPAQTDFFSAAHLRLWPGDGIIAAAISRPLITVIATEYR